MRGKPFAKGKDCRRGTGGPREGSGRPPEWLKVKCQKIIDRVELLEFLANVVKGEDMEQVVGNEGDVIQVPASVRDRIKAAEILLERGYGKPDTKIELGAESLEALLAGSNPPRDKP